MRHRRIVVSFAALSLAFSPLLHYSFTGFRCLCMCFSLERLTRCDPQLQFLLHIPNWFSIQALILAFLQPGQGHLFLRSCIQLLIDRRDLFLQATAFRLQYTGSGFSVPTPPVQLVVVPVFGQQGVWDLSSSGVESSARSLPSSDAVEETNVDSVQVQQSEG